MKKLATAIAAIALIGTPAFAAPVRAPPPAPVPVYNWTGWYAGVNAGASFGNDKTGFNVDHVSFRVPPAGPFIPFSSDIPGSDRAYPSGFMGGGQIGYSWRYSPLIVVGLEADFQGADEIHSNHLSNPYSFNVPGSAITVTGTAVTDYTTKIDWFGTVRGRIGYLWGNGAVLTYVTGGLAYGEVGINGTNTVNGAQIPPLAFSVTQAFGHSRVNAGWVVGYGAEGLIDFWGSRNWTWKIEGLYIDLGALDTAGVTTGAFAGIGNPMTGGQITTRSHFADGIVRGGLNYQFH
jgi:outer membrane immunogenic protein